MYKMPDSPTSPKLNHRSTEKFNFSAEKKMVPFSVSLTAQWGRGMLCLPRDVVSGDVITFTTDFQRDEFNQLIKHSYILKILHIQARTNSDLADANIDLWYNDRYQGEHKIIVDRNLNPFVRPGFNHAIYFTINIVAVWEQHPWTLELLP